MGNGSNPLSAVIDWTFLNEPLYRWAIFFGAVGAMMYAWHGVIDFMKE